MEQGKHKEIHREPERPPQPDISRDSDKRVQQLYSQGQSQEMIDQAEGQVASARQTLDGIQRVEEAGLSRNSPNYPGTPRVADRHRHARNDM